MSPASNGLFHPVILSLVHQPILTSLHHPIKEASLVVAPKLRL
jgi:hypothetical protein